MPPPRPPGSSGSRSNKAAAFMRKAIQYYEAGDLPKAQKNVTKYLSADPKNADANHLAGLIANQTGNPTNAITLLKRALEANPRMAMAHNNLGEAYRELEQFPEAEACYRKAIELEPGQTGFHNNLGISLLAQGRADEAIEVYTQAMRHNQRDPMVHTNLGNALVDVGKFNEAIAAHKGALAIQPSLLDAISNLGVAYLRSGDLDRARETFLQVKARQPEHTTALGSLAKIHETLGELSEAEALRERVIAIAPDDRENYLTLSDLLRYSGRPDEAVAVFERHLERAPNNMDSKVQIASIWRAAGEREKAQAYLRNALKNEPDHVAGRFVLAQMTKHTPDDENITALKELRKQTHLPAEKQTSINFGLGKAMEEIDDLDAAIDCYLDANRFRRSMFDYSHEDTVKLFTQIKETYSPELCSAREQKGSMDPTPIFIVGMPRSGTSLVEQIISSHSNVYGAGELTTFSEVATRVFANADKRYPTDLPTMPNNTFVEVGEMYVDLIRKRFGDAPHITDKMPHNFTHVGMIKLAFPNAKIVHCNRHPMDTCFSIFKHSFSESHNYAFNMEELGTYYREYLDLMSYWRTAFPGAMYDISYEALVAETEPEARKLLEYCELEWEPACLEFYKTKRVVNTISASQVRQPIYKSSVALWKRYGSRLQPLIDALGDAIPTESEE